MTRWIFLGGCMASALLALPAAGDGPSLQKIYLGSRPSVSPDGTTFVFEWKGDIWSAPVEGGVARPLTRHPAADSWPTFSPDGRQIAFQSNREDSRQVFVMPVEGGPPRQLTFHTEGAYPLSWSPDGRHVIARGSRDHDAWKPLRLFRVAVDERRAEEALFDAYGDEAVLSPDGRRVLFTREGYDLYRKGYRGSRASQIWLYDIGAREFKALAREETENRTPLWRPDGKAFYYVSGRDGTMNVWERALETGRDRQVTFFKGDSVIHPSLSRDGRTMVFRQLFDFYRLDPAAGKPVPRRIDLFEQVDYARPTVRRRFYTTVWNNDDWGSLDFSAGGLEMAFTAGGDLWVMDTVLREPRAVTGDSGSHETEAVFTPDGQALFYLSDTGDRVTLWRAEREDPKKFWWRNTAFKRRALTGDTAHRYNLSVSPDGRRLAWCEGRGALMVSGLDGFNPKSVYRSPYSLSYDWSPDGRWLVCSASDSDGNSDVWIVSADASVPPYNVSRHSDWDGSACWSPDGRLIVFVGRRGDGETDLFYAWLAREDDERSRHDRSLEKALDAMKKGGSSASKGGTTNKVAGVQIDFLDLSRRVRRVNLPGVVPARPFWSHDSKTVAFEATVNGRRGTYKIAIPDALTPEFLTERTGAFARWIEKDNRILWLHNGLPAHFNSSFSFEAFQETDIEAYQRLGFRIAWRLLRDRFYDGRLNNLDWNAVRLKYEDAAARAPDYSVFQRVVLLMLGELNASHMGFEENDSAQKEWSKPWSTGQWKLFTAHLGLRFDPAHRGEGWRVRDVIPGGPADTEKSRVEAGEIVWALDGAPVNSDTDPASVLNGRLPRDVRLTVGSGDRRRDVGIRPVAYSDIRDKLKEAFVRDTRRRVEKLGGGRLGYLNIERMNWEDLRQFEQDVFAEGVGRDGLVIDVRNNGGGFTADRLLSILCNPRHAITVPRDGDRSYPAGYLGKPVWNGPLVVLCNQGSGSNAEIFSHAIQTLKRGKLVGVPTMGGVISTPEKNVLDLGRLRVPDRGWFLPDGRDMELNGAVPDVVLWLEPSDEVARADPQLDKAVEVLLQEIEDRENNPPPRLVPASEARAASSKPDQPAGDASKPTGEP